MLKRQFYIPFSKDSETHAIDYFKGIFEDASITTLRRVLSLKGDNDVSQEELHWQFAEGWNSIGALLAHTVAVRDIYRIETIEARKLTKEEYKGLEPALTMGKFLPELINDNPLEYYLKELERSKTDFLNALDSVSPERFIKKVDDDQKPPVPDNVAWLLYHVTEDEVHHRGQISIIRKLYKLHKEK